MSAHPFDLIATAYAEMIREGFHPEFPDGSEAQVAAIRAAQGVVTGADVRDLRELVWSSIDNDTSRDLDQIEVAERVDGGVRVRAGIADVSGVFGGCPGERSGVWEPDLL